jgi:hypothetical protein
MMMTNRKNLRFLLYMDYKKTEIWITKPASTCRPIFKTLSAQSKFRHLINLPSGYSLSKSPSLSKRIPFSKHTKNSYIFNVIERPLSILFTSMPQQISTVLR